MVTIGGVKPTNHHYGDEVMLLVDAVKGHVALNFSGVNVSAGNVGRQVSFGFGFGPVELDKLIALLQEARTMMSSKEA